MLPQDCAAPSIASLFTTWLSVTGQLMRAIGASAEQRIEDFPDMLKDSCLDFSGTPTQQENIGLPLPPLDPEQLITALRDSIQEKLRLAATLINEDPSGLWAPVTE